MTPISGRDVGLKLLLNGALVAFTDDIQNFTVDAKFDKMEAKIIGENGRRLQSEPIGWGGEFEIVITGSSTQEFIDTYRSYKLLRLPAIVQLTHTDKYNDYTSKSYLYVGVELFGFNSTIRRGDFTTCRIEWDSGSERIALS